MSSGLTLATYKPNPAASWRGDAIRRAVKRHLGPSTSEGYKTKASAQNGVESVQKNAPDATVVDLTE